MANQRSFAELEHDAKKRTTRRERFLAKMDGLMPWDALERRIEPFYPKAGRDRRLAKNTQRIALLPGFANLLIAGRYASA